MLFFFFKQKTAYEMRISDWSSDVCSSDLLYNMLPAEETEAEGRTAAANATVRTVYIIGPDQKIKAMLIYPMSSGRNLAEILRLLDRSEEHTSELQSLMRISYAVFCLKKKKHRQ